MAQSITNTTSRNSLGGALLGLPGGNKPKFQVPAPQNNPALSLIKAPTVQGAPTQIPQSVNRPVSVVAGDQLNTGAISKPGGQVQAAAVSNPNMGGNTSLGSYKGVQITPGDVQGQIDRINAAGTPPVATPANSLVTTPATPKTTFTQTATKGIFPDVVTSLVGSSKPSKEQQDLLKSLTESAALNRRLGDQAAQTSQTYADEIARIGDLGAGAQAGYLSKGTNVVGAGNAAIASQSASARMQALATAQQAQLAGVDRGLTANQQQAAVLADALAGANTQQQLTQAGLGVAGGLAAPSVTSFGQTVFDPTSAGFAGGGTLDPQMAAAQLAAEVKSGRMSYDQAVASLGYAGGAGQQFLNNALQGTGYNIQQGQATLAGQNAVFQQLPAMEAADTAAEGVKNKVITYLAANPQLNPAELNKVNFLAQWLGKETSDPKYQTLFNLLNEYTSTLAPILGVGGDTTNLKTQIAQDFINAAASGASIAEVLENIQSLSKGKIQDLRSGALGQGVQSSPISGSGTGSGSIWDF